MAGQVKTVKPTTSQNNQHPGKACITMAERAIFPCCSWNWLPADISARLIGFHPLALIPPGTLAEDKRADLGSADGAHLLGLHGENFLLEILKRLLQQVLAQADGEVRPRAFDDAAQLVGGMTQSVGDGIRIIHGHQQGVDFIHVRQQALGFVGISFAQNDPGSAGAVLPAFQPFRADRWSIPPPSPLAVAKADRG